MAKARIWKENGLWRLNVPGVGGSVEGSFELIRHRWLAFLNWAK